MSSLSPSPFLGGVMQTRRACPCSSSGSRLAPSPTSSIVGASCCSPGLDAGAADFSARATIAGVIDAKGLLASTFVLGLGAALNSPTWQAAMPDLVPRSRSARRSGPERCHGQCGARSRTCPRGAIVAAWGPGGGIPPEYFSRSSESSSWCTDGDPGRRKHLAGRAVGGR